MAKTAEYLVCLPLNIEVYFSYEPGVKVLILKSSGYVWLLMLLLSFHISNRLMMSCHLLHNKMQNKQLKLSKNRNTYLVITLKGSGLISQLNNSWKNGN